MLCVCVCGFVRAACAAAAVAGECNNLWNYRLTFYADNLWLAINEAAAERTCACVIVLFCMPQEHVVLHAPHTCTICPNFPGHCRTRQHGIAGARTGAQVPNGRTPNPHAAVESPALAARRLERRRITACDTPTATTAQHPHHYKPSPHCTSPAPRLLTQRTPARATHTQARQRARRRPPRARRRQPQGAPPVCGSAGCLHCSARAILAVCVCVVC